MSTTETMAAGELETLSPQEVAQMFAANEIVLIDVRTPMEYAFEHIKGALLAPMASLDPGKLPTDDGKRVVFHCGSGMRSKMVAQRCLVQGRGKVAHMGGGFMGWKRAGLSYLATNPATGGPVEKSDPAS